MNLYKIVSVLFFTSEYLFNLFLFSFIHNEVRTHARMYLRGSSEADQGLLTSEHSGVPPLRKSDVIANIGFSTERSVEFCGEMHE